MRMVVVSGVPGVGKSTALSILANDYASADGGPLVVAPEPVEQWEACLRRHATGEASALELQLEVLMAFSERERGLRASGHLSPFQGIHGTGVIVAERDHADATMFGLAMLGTGALTSMEYSVLSRVSGALFRDSPPHATHLFLRADVDTALGRVRTRGRSSEAGMKHEYMETLAVIHENTAKRAAWRCVDTDGVEPAAVAERIAAEIGLVRKRAD